MALNLILKDGSTVELSNYTIDDFIVHCDNRTSLNSVWDKMTTNNLKEVQISSDGNIIQSMEEITILGVQTVFNTDSTFTAHFYYRGECVEDPYAIAGKILLGEE